MVPPLWATQWPSHVGLMITVVNQAEADRDIPKLLELKARLGIPWVGLSIEPMLGPIDLTTLSMGESKVDCLQGYLSEPTETPGIRQNSPTDRFVDLVICGGESGHNARPMHPDWARSLRDQCAAAETPFHFKQWGEWIPWEPDSVPMWKNQSGSVEDGNCLFPSDMDLDPKWQDGLLESQGQSHCAFQRIGKAKAGRLLDGHTHDGMIT
ncbi:MAG: DUF5131 family protein [Sulfitobacter sp.]